MRVALEILEGPYTGRVVDLAPGESVTVGRTAKSQLMLPHDSFLSGQHFTVECRGEGCLARDCNSSNGTWVNGEKIAERALAHGDQIAAGQTRFVVHIGAADDADEPTTKTTVMFAVPTAAQLAAARADAPPAMSPVQQNVLEYLRRSPAPLYAMLNAGIEERIPQILSASGEFFQDLSQGFAAVDPLPSVYFAHVPVTSQLLPVLIQAGWGKHWLLFFTSVRPAGEVQTHLREFLQLQTVGGKSFFFRYYDPRVLRYLLPGCTLRETTQFFGPIQCFVMEDPFDPGKLIEFTITPQGLSGRVQPLL